MEILQRLPVVSAIASSVFFFQKSEVALAIKNKHPRYGNSLWGGPFEWGIDAQMGAGLDHEIRLDLEIGPITILEYETLETNVDNELII